MNLDAWLRLWAGPGAGPAGGLGMASAAFQRFAADYAQLAAKPGATRAEWEALGRRLSAEIMPAWPVGLAPAAAEGGAAALAAMSAAIASGFARRLKAEPRPATLRAAFDAWVDAAEEAFRATAFTDGFTAAQAALCNELVRLRSSQQATLDEAMRLAGMPSRGEVDALHDSVRELREALASREAGSGAPRRRRRKPA
jgi:hypothetical protein